MSNNIVLERALTRIATVVIKLITETIRDTDSIESLFIISIIIIIIIIDKQEKYHECRGKAFSASSRM